MDERTLHQLELPCPTTAHAHIPDPALLHNIMQSLHSLLNRGFRVKSMELQDINVFELKSFKRVLDRSEDPLGHQLSYSLIVKSAGLTFRLDPL